MFLKTACKKRLAQLGGEVAFDRAAVNEGWSQRFQEGMPPVVR